MYVDDVANTTHSLLWSQSGNKGNSWLQGQMPIPPQPKGYQVSVTHSGQGYQVSVTHFGQGYQVSVTHSGQGYQVSVTHSGQGYQVSVTHSEQGYQVTVTHSEQGCSSVEHQVQHTADTGVTPRSSKAVAITWISICVHIKHPKHW